MSNPGDLDLTFGNSGFVITDFSNNTSNEIGYSLVIQNDGKIILAGRTNIIGFGSNFALIRYNPNGSIDTKFGTNGIVITDFNNGTDVALSIAIQLDDKIVVCGYVNGTNFGLARYNIDGSLDTTFGTNQTGKVTTLVGYGNGRPSALALQWDGKIILGGYSQTGTTNQCLVRYNSIGSIDTTFGNNGIVETTFYSTTNITSIKILNDGKILTGGSTLSNNNTNFNYTLARYTKNGILDTTFGTGGKVTTDFATKNDESYSMQIQSDGKIVLAGYANNGSGNGGNEFGIARYNNNGTLDETFGTGGKVYTNFFNLNDSAYSIAIQSNGKIIACGVARFGSQDIYALARYYIDGSLDTTFGTNGIVTTNFGNANRMSYGRSLAIQRDGKIVVGGYTNEINVVGSDNFIVARFIGDSVPISNICFIEGNKVETDQGLVEIQNIDENIHTINNKKIVSLVKTVTEESYLICIEKDAFGENIPSQDTVMSLNHKLVYNEEVVSAYELIGKNDKIYKVYYNGELLYNILMEDYDNVCVNGLTCENLHPLNRVAQLYLLLKQQPKEMHNYMINCYNDKFAKKIEV